ncbi:MAG: hypothetical protein EOO70_00330 [Myxococcaceae bacterium]|nr:MAG: hypothetical protein EOO70_00330 [Myxococcaceae bacterium]
MATAAHRVATPAPRRCSARALATTGAGRAPRPRGTARHWPWPPLLAGWAPARGGARRGQAPGPEVVLGPWWPRSGQAPRPEVALGTGKFYGSELARTMVATRRAGSTPPRWCSARTLAVTAHRAGATARGGALHVVAATAPGVIHRPRWRSA